MLKGIESELSMVLCWPIPLTPNCENKCYFWAPISRAFTQWKHFWYCIFFCGILHYWVLLTGVILPIIGCWGSFSQSKEYSSLSVQACAVTYMPNCASELPVCFYIDICTDVKIINRFLFLGQAKLHSLHCLQVMASYGFSMGFMWEQAPVMQVRINSTQRKYCFSFVLVMPTMLSTWNE